MSFFTRRRRRKLLSEPVPEHWRVLLRREVPLLDALTPDQFETLLDLARVFISEKNFEGAGGFEVTEDARVIIAALACLPLLGRARDVPGARVYPTLCSIVVYPNDFVVPLEEHQPDGTVYDGEEELSGESWGRGTVVLSWSDVVDDAAHPSDGRNVVLHEFAHQLDEETGEPNGVPLLPTREAREEWARVMTREFDRLVRDVERRRRVLLDDYATEDPAEFFAVATEFFFERPHELKARHPELYAQLLAFYELDPAQWPRTRGRPTAPARG